MIVFVILILVLSAYAWELHRFDRRCAAEWEAWEKACKGKL